MHGRDARILAVGTAREEERVNDGELPGTFAYGRPWTTVTCLFVYSDVLLLLAQWTSF